MLKVLCKMMEKYKNLNIAVKASLWFAICSILQKGISVITLPIFTRIMNTEQYGQYSIFQTWYNILIIIVTLNIHQEIFNKGLSDNEKCRDRFTSNQAGLLIFLTVFFCILYLLLHNIINDFTGLTNSLVLIMMLEILANALIGLWSARKRFEFDYKKIVTLIMTMSIINPIIGIFAVYESENKAFARIVSNAIVPIIVAVFIIIIFKRKGKFFDNFYWWKNSILKSLPLIPHYLSLVLLNQSDKLMIDYFGNTSQAGIYSVAHSSGLLMTIINNSINGSFVPWAYDKLKNKNGENIKNVSNGLMLIVLLCNIVLIWFAPELIKILASPEYHEAIWCLVPISASVFFYFVYMLFVDVEIYYGANKYVAIASVFAAVLNIILNYIFIPIYGYFAAGYTTLFSYFMTMILHYIFMKITLNKNNMKTKLFDEKTIAILSVILLTASAIAMILYNYIIIRIIFLLITALIIYLKRNKIINVLKTLKNKNA